MSDRDNDELNGWYDPGKTDDRPHEDPPGASGGYEYRPPYQSPGAPLNGARHGVYDSRYLPRRRNATGKVVAVVVALLIVIFVTSTILGALNISHDSSSNADGYSEDYHDYFDEYASYYTTTGVYDIARLTAGPADVGLDLRGHDYDGELTLREVYAKVLPSVCGITAGRTANEGSYSWGTGIIISSDGYILTNAHVIDDTDYATVSLPGGEKFEALLVGADSVSDIAVLKIEAEDLTPAEFGNLEGLAVGDAVAAIGNPLGASFSGTMTNGIISAIDRDIYFDGRRMTLLQTNAAINEGNSGGPLINMFGQVIGVTNMKMDSRYSTIEGIGFAIPVTGIKPVVDALIRDGRITGQPALGITVMEVDSDIAAMYSIPEGLYIQEIVKTSDAFRHGLRKGDIITHANDEQILTTDDLAAVLDGLGIGQKIELTVYRDGRTLHYSIEIMDRGLLYG